MQQWSYENTVLSKDIFIKIQFYQKTVLSKYSFIKRQFYQKDSFIKRQFLFINKVSHIM